MHPIEHLRYVARAHGVDPAGLVSETAHALGSMHFDAAGLVVACRRIVERHPFAGPLWWLCANVATSSEPFDAVWELAEQVHSDRTASELAAALPDEADVVTIGDPSVIGSGLARRGDVRVLALDIDHSATSFVRRLERNDVDYEPVDAGAAGTVAQVADVVLVEALALDADRVIVPSGSTTIAACAAAFDTPVWLVAGIGRRLPTEFIDAMVVRRDAIAADQDEWTIDVEVLPTRLVTDIVGPHGIMPMGPPAARPECPLAAELLRTPAM
ncbi:hypothetical protein [Ilumatobacter nonamiensis]|uniref:hypothetical protein n=1 Tax=Ilumatobacter nonamiensis TaxID=467093 RepID=UPI000346314A|nr:hypothetical protein [Ilumatobacter nonamiensis]